MTLVKPDLVLDNANVITVDSGLPRAASIAILGDRIVGVGKRHAFATTGARSLDMDGATVIPGFNDAHNHMAIYGATLNEVAIQPAIASRSKRSSTLLPVAPLRPQQVCG